MGRCAEKLQNWRRLYKAALAETNVQKLPLCIEEARKALILKSRELFATSREEAEAIDDARYVLKALDNCLKLKTQDRRATKRAA